MAETGRTRKNRTLEQQLRDNEVNRLELGLKAHTQLDRDEESLNNQAETIRTRLDKWQAQLDRVAIDLDEVAAKRDVLTSQLGSRANIEARIAELSEA